MVGDSKFSQSPDADTALVHVLPKPGVTDAVAESAHQAMTDLGLNPSAIRTFEKYWISSLPDDQLQLLCDKLLANDSIEEVRRGALDLQELGHGETYQ
ncbi:phosphoribosylformylglycinamidine synthase subunit PurS, partial [bacterium]|nr:phosphoribosylformylglycinamidine synthase subunit PurS [bacterium]